MSLLNEPLEDTLTDAESIVLCRVVQSALQGGQLSDSNPVALFMDTNAFQAECRALIQAFSSSTTHSSSSCLHGFAVKACPVVGVLQAAAAVGMGGECASAGEVALCLAAGMEPHRIVLDSPCKTNTLLREMLALGVHVNADNLDEVERIAAILDEPAFQNGAASRSIGLRVNPQIGAGTIGMTSTAGTTNKFGVPLKEERQEIMAAFEKYSFLTCVHVHVGSQGVSPQQLVDGAAAAVELAQEIGPQVTTIDIGGGLSVHYGPDKVENTMISMETYAQMLRQQVPKLFQYKIITEFGRRLVAPHGTIMAMVQNIKVTQTKTYVVGHVGADLLLRNVYAPDQWRHAIHVYDTTNQTFRTGTATQRVHVAGPLCFSGDLIAKDRLVPADTAAGDVLVLPMSGAYTIGMYSRHTSQLVPAVYGYDGTLENPVLVILKKAETTQDLVKFWGG